MKEFTVVMKMAEADDPSATGMSSSMCVFLLEPIPGIQVNPQKDRFHEKGERLHKQRQCDCLTRDPHKHRPQQAKLQTDGGSSNDTYSHGDDKSPCPSACQQGVMDIVRSQPRHSASAIISGTPTPMEANIICTARVRPVRIRLSRTGSSDDMGDTPLHHDVKLHVSACPNSSITHDTHDTFHNGIQYDHCCDQADNNERFLLFAKHIPAILLLIRCKLWRYRQFAKVHGFYPENLKNKSLYPSVHGSLKNKDLVIVSRQSATWHL